jgi:hypothetical protein
MDTDAVCARRGRWNARTLRLLAEQPSAHGGARVHVVVGVGRRRVATGGGDGQVRLWDWQWESSESLEGKEQTSGGGGGDWSERATRTATSDGASTTATLRECGGVVAAASDSEGESAPCVRVLLPLRDRGGARGDAPTTTSLLAGDAAGRLCVWQLCSGATLP